MKGFIGVGSIFMILGMLVLFGGALFDLTTTSARCALGVSGVGNYSCNELGYTAGSTLILPDRNVKIGTESIVQLRSMDLESLRNSGLLSNETLDGLDVLYDQREQGFRMQIYLGLGGIVIVFGLLMMVMLRITRSTLIDSGSYLVAFVAALCIISAIHVGYTGIVEGQVELPFTGVMTLLTHPDVMWDVVDDTSLLPGTLTSDDILEDGNP